LLTGQTLSAPITVASISGLAEHYRIPQSNQFSVGVQRELWREGVIAVSYVGNQNRHQTYQTDINSPAQSNLPALINGTVAYNNVVPYPGYHSIVLVEAGANSHYNSLQMNFHTQASKRLTLQATYTLARSVDPTTSFGGDLSTISNPYDRSYDNGPALSDRTHIGLINFVYDLPIFANGSKLTKSVLGGWQLSGIVMMQTGLPLFITQGGTQGSNGLANATNRPNINGEVSYPATVDKWFNTSIFSSPAIGAWGNAPRGNVRGPGRHNWNTSLFKRFMLSEARGSFVEFRAESFNTWNHTQFRNVSTGFSSGDFGSVTSVWDPRVFQFGLKLAF
jgi:hypothetical protein